jgi:hypothetical protein
VLPEATALVPVKAKTPKDIGGGAVGALGKIEPNPLSHNLGQFKLLRQLGFQETQNGLRGQFTVAGVRGEGAGF